MRKRREIIRRFTSLVLCNAMVISSIPMPAFAEEDTVILAEENIETSEEAQEIIDALEERISALEDDVILAEDEPDESNLAEGLIDDIEIVQDETEEMEETSVSSEEKETIETETVHQEEETETDIDREEKEIDSWTFVESLELEIESLNSSIPVVLSEGGAETEMTADVEVTGGVVTVDLSTGTVTGYTGSPTEIIFPTEVDEIKITSISSYAFKDCDSLKKVKIPDGYTEIGAYAFYSCDNLSEAEFPKEMNTIGNYAFAYCGKITEINLPEQMNDLGADAFEYCTKLTEIEVPEGIASLKSRSFYGCSGLKKAVLPSTLTTLGERAFYDCSSLSAVYFKGNAPSYGSYALSGNIPGSLILYYQDGKDGWSSPLWNGFQTSTYVPVQSDSLIEVKVTGGFVVADSSSGTIIGYKGSPTKAVLPESVNGIPITKVAENAFSGCTSLNEVTIPESYTELGTNAFLNCTRLQDVTIVGKVTTIPKNAFRGCSGMTKLILNEKLESIGAYAFQGCTGLTELKLPDSVKKIEEYAFSGCSRIQTVAFGNGLEKIGSSAFYNCDGLTAIELPAGVTEIPDSLFYDCDSLTSVSFKGAVTKIGSQAFYSCGKLTGIELPQTLTELGSYVFGYCSSLEKLSIPNGVQEISYSLFYSCTKLTEVTFEGSVIKIGSSAFNSCSSLTKIQLGETLTEIGSYAFYSCSKLEQIDIPDGVTTIGSYAFSDCYKLNDVKLPASLTSIGSNAFYYCSALTEIVIQEGITTIPDYAFSYCSNLRKVTIPSTVTGVAKYAFRDCPKLTAVYFYGAVPSSWNSYAFYNTSPNLVLYHLDGANGWTNPTWNGYNTAVFYPADAEGIVLYEVNGGTLTINTTAGEVIGYEGTPTELTLPAEVNGIAIKKLSDNAFNGCSTLTKVEIPEGYEQIGINAFYGCTSLTEMKAAKTVRTIGAGAFLGCTSLTSAELAEGMEVLGERVFYNCRTLTGLTLPSTLKTIGNEAFYNCGKLTGIELPPTLTDLGSNVFAYCSNLEKISIPKGVQEIPYSLFYSCTKLTEVTFEGSVTKIGGSAFRGCSSLTKVQLSSTVTEIGSYAFSSCSKLEQIDIPDGVTTIGSYAFSDCYKLNDVKLPASLASIGSYAFYDCSALTEIVIPEGITTIPDYAFSYCSNLKKVTLPSTVTTLGKYAFKGCTKLAAVYFYGDAPYSLGSEVFYKVSSNLVLYYLDGAKGWTNPTWKGWNTALFVPVGTEGLVEYAVTGGKLLISMSHGMVVGYEGDVTEITLPSEVNGVKITRLNDNLFNGCSTLTKVEIPEGYEQIGTNTFYGCTSLTEMKAAKTVRTIGARAFSGCTSLASAELAEGMEELGKKAFYNCRALTGLTLPSTLKTIGNEAFYNCDGLTTVALPSGVTEIADSLFYDCDSLTSVSFNGAVTKIGSQAFYSCGKLNEIKLPPTLTDLGSNVFAYCSNLEKISIPKGVQEISEYLFCSCTKLTEVTFEGSVTKIGSSAFYGCSSLTKVQLPATVTEIGSYAFLSCSKLEQIDIPDGVTTIGSYAFSYCYKLNDVKVPASLTSIGSNAFYNCSALTEIVIQEGITTIPSEAFYGCSNLKKVTLPSTVTTLGKYAFRDCPKLTAVYFYGDAPSSLGYEVFYNGSSNLVLYYLDGAKGWTSPTWQGWNTALFVPVGTEGLVEYAVTGGKLLISMPHGMVVGYEGDITEITLPSEVDGAPITKLNDNLFNGCSSLIKVEIPEGYTQIGTNAFLNCSSLQSIVLPGTITELPAQIFSGCSSLEEVVLQRGVVSIGTGAFRGCSTLQRINLPETLTEIGDEAFSGCSSLEEMYLPSLLQKIGNSAFKNCKALKELELPANMNSVGTDAFYYCTSLQSMTIPEGITQIPEYMLAQCTALKEVVLPDTVKEIGKGAFYYCSQLTTLRLPETIEIIGGSAFANCSALSEVSLPDGLEVLEDSLFYYCRNLEKVTIPDSVKEMRSRVFYGCSKLTQLILPEKMNSIGSSSFEDCSQLKQIRIPEGIKTLESRLFQYCVSLSKVTIPSTVTSISGNVFYNCKNLTDIYCYGVAPSGSSIALNNENSDVTFHYVTGRAGWTTPKWNGYNALPFASQNGRRYELTSEALNWQEARSAAEAAGGKLASITSKDELEFILAQLTGTESERYWLGAQKSENSWNWSSGEVWNYTAWAEDQPGEGSYLLLDSSGKWHTAQADETYRGLVEYEDYYKEDDTQVDTALGEAAIQFDKKTGTLQKVSGTMTVFEIPTAIDGVPVIQIATGCFGGAPLLKEIRIAEGQEYFQTKDGLLYTADGNTLLAAPRGISGRIELADGVQKIERQAFAGCTMLTEVVLPDTLTEIGTAAFHGCTSLGAVKTGTSLAVIGDSAFRSCRSLKEVILPDTVRLVGSYAFAECENLQQVQLSAAMTEIAVGTFQYCSSLEQITLPEAIRKISSAAFGYDAALHSIYFEGDAPTLTGSAFPILDALTFYVVRGRYGWNMPKWQQWKTAYYEAECFEGYGFYAAEGGSFKYCMEDGNIVGYTGAPTEILIPCEVDGTTIRKIAENAFADCTSLQAIYLPITLTELAEHAFEGIENLKMYGAQNENWESYANTHGYTYQVCAVQSVSPSTASTIGGKEYSSVRVLMNADISVPLTLNWTNETGEKIEILADETTDRYNYKKRHTYKLDLSDTVSGIYTLRIQNEDYGIQYEVTYEIDRTAPTAVSEFAVTAGDLCNVITWKQAVEADVNKYQLYRKTAEDDAYTLLTTINSRTTTSYTDQAVEAGVEYWYQLQAIDKWNQAGDIAGPVGSMPQSDQTPPQITSVSPHNGSVIYGMQEFVVTAADNKTVRSVSMQYRTTEDGEWSTAETVSTDGTARFSLDTTQIETKKIWVQFQAEDLYGNKAVSAAAYQYQIDNQGPEQVKNVAYTSTACTVTLTWDDVSDNDLAYFLVEKLEEDQNWSIVGKSYQTKGMNLYGLAPLQENTYRVIAYDRYGNRGIPSDAICTRTTADQTSPVVSKITPEAKRCKGIVNMTFELSDDVALKQLVVQVSPDAVNWSEVKTILIKAAQAEATAAYQLNTEQYAEGSLYVRGIVTDQAGNVSKNDDTAPYVEYYVDRTAPAVPTGLTAEVSAGSIILSWTQGSEVDLAGYQVIRIDVETGENVILATGIKKVGYIDRTPSFDKQYYYQIQALDVVGNCSKASDSVLVQLEADNEKPEIYSISPSADYVLGAATSIKVLAGDNDQVSKLYYRYSVDGTNWTEEQVLQVEERSSVQQLAIVPGALQSDQLQIEVWCADRSGNSSEKISRSWSIDTEAPQIPKLTVSQQDGKAILCWTSGAETDLAGFRIYRKLSTESSYTCIAQRTAEESTDYSWYDETVMEGRAYWYYVEAVDSRENSSRSYSAQVNIPTGSKKDTAAPHAYISAETIGEAGIETAFSGALSTDNLGIISYQWDFGDGTKSSLMSPRHAYMQAGTYMVTLTVTDAAGNTDSTSVMITIKEKNMTGKVKIHVQDENGTAVSGAGVYFDLGADDMTVVCTDESGNVTLTAAKGVYSVGAYKDGYLPVKEEVQILENATASLTLTMVQKDIVIGELTVHRMTLEEIVAAGISVKDEANQNVFRFETTLTYAGETLEVDGICNGEGKTLSNPKQFTIGSRQLTVGVLNITTSGNGHGSSTGGGGTASEKPQPVIAVLDIPGTASWLKDFFDVQLHIVNQADEEFVLEQCSATLNVPSGLTLMESNRTSGDATVSMGAIEGQSAAVAEWILRGDTPGSYHLNADFSAVLRDFGADIKANFATKEPFTVRDGSNLYLDFEVESGIISYTDGAIRVGFRNEDADPVYYPKISLEKVKLIRSYKKKGLSLVKTSEDILESGEEIWFEYLIDRDDWAELIENNETSFYLQDQIFRAISGIKMNYNQEIIQPLTIAPEKIEVCLNSTGKKISLLDLKKDDLSGASVPDLLIKTYRQDLEGNDIPTSMEVTVCDGYIMGQQKEGEEEPKIIHTNSNGEYVLKGYEITDWFPQKGEDNDDNKTNYKAYSITFYSSRALNTLSVVARGATAATGQLKVNVLAKTEDGEYKRISGAKVSAGSLSEVTKEKGQVTLTGVPTGNVELTIKADGYYTVNDVVSVSDQTEKTYYLDQKEGEGKSGIQNVTCSLTSNSLGNVVVVPEGRVTGNITFTLEKDIADGEKFDTYCYMIRNENGVLIEEGNFNSDKFLINLSKLKAHYTLSFALKAKDSYGVIYQSAERDSHLMIIDCPNFLNSFVYNVSELVKEKNKGKWTLDGADALKLFLGDNTETVQSFNLTKGITYIAQDETGTTLMALLRRYSMKVEESQSYPVTATYEASGKATITINIADGTTTKSSSSESLDVLSRNGFFSIKEEKSEKSVSTTGSIKVDLEFTYNPVKDVWDLTIYGTMEGKTKVPLAKVEYKVAYGNADFTGTGTLKMKLAKTTLGNQNLDELSEFLTFSEGSIQGEVKLAAGGMLGKKDLASIGAYAKIGMKMGFMPNFKITANTEIGWEGNILFLKTTDEWYANDYELYSSKGTSSKIRVLQHRLLTEAAESETAFVTNTGENIWNGGTDQLAANVYYDTEPQLTVLPDGSILMVFVNYREGTDSSNPVTVYYTRCIDGIWTDPQEVCADGTVGLYPSLQATDKGAVLTWMKLNQKLGDSESYTYQQIAEAIYQNMTVCQAYFDTETGTWTQKEPISDKTLIFSPETAYSTDSEMTVWISNAANTETATEEQPDHIGYRLCSADGSVLASGILPAPAYDISDIALTATETGYQLTVQTIDENGKGQLWTGVYDSTGWGTLEPLGSSESERYAAGYVNGRLYYLRDNQIMYSENGMEKQLLCSTMLNNVEDMTVAAFGDNGVLIAWALNEQGGSICAAVSYDGRNFSDPFVVTTDEGICSAPQISEEKDSLLFVYQTAMTENRLQYQLKSYRMKMGVDLAVNDQSSDSMLYAGAQITTSFEIVNAGIGEAGAASVAVSADRSGNNPIASTELSQMGAGMISWTVPQSYEGEDYYLVIQPVGAVDIDQTNNAVLIGTAMRDVAILSGDYMGDDSDGTHLLISLENQGIVSSGTLTLTLEDIDTEQILYEQTLEELAGGAQRDISVVLEREPGEISILARITAEKDELSYDNNTDLIVINQLTGIEMEDPECSHQWNSGTVTRSASCTMEGEILYTCTLCQETKIETTQKDSNNHTVVSDAAVAATCTSTGKTEGSHCSACGKVLSAQQITPKLSHVYSAYQVTKEPTALEAGVKVRRCKCGATESEQIDKLTPTISLNVSSIPLKEGQSTSKVKVSNLATGDRVVSWKSSNTKVVRVSQKGVITAQKKAAGKSANVIVTLASGKTAKLIVKVQKKAVQTTKITGLKSKVTLEKGKKFTLSAAVYPITSLEKLTYQSSDKKVVTVSSKGVLTAKKSGTAKITVKAGKKKAVVTVTVPKVKTKELKLNKTEIKLKIGKTFQIIAKVTPTNSEEKITYKTANKKIAAVSAKGKITAKKAGKTKIRVQSGSKWKTVQVTVTKK